MANLLLEHCKDISIVDDLKSKGYYFFDELYSNEFCQHAINFLDKNRGDAIERNYACSESRIWGSEQKSPILKNFFDDSVLAYNQIFNKSKTGETLLAISNGPLASNDEHSRLGRWHIDSFFNQWKVFLFLTDANDNSGPFEFIPGTNTWSFRLRHMFRYLNPINLPVNQSRSYSSLSDKWVCQLKETMPSKAAVCKAGTVLIVYTNAIHRARPCYEGSRYALTTYI